MSKIERLIAKEYQDPQDLIELIRKYDFEKFLNGFLDEFEISISNSNDQRLSDIASLLLTRTNENLKGISLDEKRKLEFLLSDIFQSLMKTIQSSEILSKIQGALLDTCNLMGYDYNTLEQMLGLKKQMLLKPKISNMENFPYYKWKGIDYEKDELIRFLKEKGLIYSVKEFRKIFAPISEHFKFHGNKEAEADFIIIFDILKEQNLIQPKVLSGHYTPLVRYGVDNEGEFLFKNAPNRIHEYAKRDMAGYTLLKGKYTEKINKIAQKTLSQRVVNDH